MLKKKKALIKFNWADTWLLLSIIYASGNGGRTALLVDIIAYGDYIQHAIFTLSELRGGFYRLLTSGYVAETPEGFLPKKNILDLYLGHLAGKKTSRVDKDLEFLREILGAPEWWPGYNPNKVDLDGRYEKINKEIIRQAYDEYRRMIKRGKI